MTIAVPPAAGTLLDAPFLVVVHRRVIEPRPIGGPAGRDTARDRLTQSASVRVDGPRIEIRSRLTMKAIRFWLGDHTGSPMVVIGSR